MMAGLFPEPSDDPAVLVIRGLTYRPNYVSPHEEARLVELIDAGSWDMTWERRRQPYGGRYGRGGGEVPAIPEWGRRLAEQIFHDGLTEIRFDQMLVNEYLPGQGIALHVDYEPFDRTVASLSLLSACVMNFRHAAEHRREALLLAPRSLLVLSDAARYDWQHGIARRRNDRWQGERIARSRRLSITFRTVRRKKDEAA